MKDEDPAESTVIRAGQRPPMMLGVPLNVFLIECLVVFLLFAFLGLWAIAFLALHILPFTWTTTDLHWPTTKLAYFKYWWFVDNKGLKNPDAITFCVSPIRNKYKDYEP